MMNEYGITYLLFLMNFCKPQGKKKKMNEQNTITK